jgi:hypothetical protein
MKAPITLLAFLLPALASAAVVEGAHFRMSADALVIDRIAVLGSDHLNKRSDALRTSSLDYWIRLGTCRVFIREGSISLLDPESLDATVDFFGMVEEKGGYKIFTMVSHDKTEAAASIMIRPVRGTEHSSEDPGVYFSVRATEVRLLREGFEKLVLKAELKIGNSDYKKIEECDFAAALLPLAAFLKERANQSPEATAIKSPPSKQSP